MFPVYQGIMEIIQLMSYEGRNEIIAIEQSKTETW